MNPAKLLISLPSDLSARFRAVVPIRQRSSVIRHLLEKEIKKREKALYECASAVEADSQLNEEMREWDITLNDGLEEDESW